MLAASATLEPPYFCTIRDTRGHATGVCHHGLVSDLIVRAEGVRKRYGDFWAVDGVDLEIARGECLAMLGPNGAGKTTFTEILEGYRSRDAGSVDVLGVDPAHPTNAWKSRIGIVLQQDRDLGDLTVSEAVHHFSHYYPHPAHPEEVIASVGLQESAGVRIDRLSGGQRRRLDVALGIIGQPEMLFLDEPTTGFDPEARRDFWQLIDQLKLGGTTILLTTHYLEEAEALADRVAVIARGRLLACAPPDQLDGRNNGATEVHWSENGESHQERTQEPTAFIRALSDRIGGEIPGLIVRRPSLEDVYLNLIAGDSVESR
jgi:ABC-2 type transport system ATP-binding protein